MSGSNHDNLKKVENTMNDVAGKFESATKGVDQQLGGLTKHIESWMGKLPKFPQNLAHWLGKYLWILALVFGVLGIIQSFKDFSSFFKLNSFLSSYPEFLYNRFVDSNNKTYIILAAVVGLITSLLYLLAVMPLKNKKVFGWKLLYWSALIGIIGYIVAGILTFNVTLILLTAIFGVIGFWILFGIRGQFTQK